MTTLTLVNLRIPADLDQRFAALAAATKRTKAHYFREALGSQIDELEAVHISEERLAALRAGKTSVVPLDEIMNELNVER